MNDTDDLQRQLLTLAGSIMEDASAAALLGSDHQPTALRVDALARTVRDLAALVRVMRLLERGAV